VSGLDLDGRGASALRHGALLSGRDHVVGRADEVPARDGLQGRRSGGLSGSAQGEGTALRPLDQSPKIDGRESSKHLCYLRRQAVLPSASGKAPARQLKAAS
jgi:hypothetical protein